MYVLIAGIDSNRAIRTLQPGPAEPAADRTSHLERAGRGDGVGRLGAEAARRVSAEPRRLPHPARGAALLRGTLTIYCICYNMLVYIGHYDDVLVK